VGRNVKAASSDIQLKENARVAGGLYYTSNRDAKMDQKSEVKGETAHTTPPKEKSRFNVMFYLFLVVSLTLVGLVLAFFFPRFMQKTSDQVVANAPKAMLTGLIGGLLVIALPIGLLVSLAGIPLAIAVLLGGLIGAILSGPITAYWVGRLVLRKRESVNPVLVALIGGPILITLYHIPFVGLLVLLLAYWIGFGALLLSLKPFVGNRLATETAGANSGSNKSGKQKK